MEGQAVTNEAIGPQVPRLLELRETEYSRPLFVPWLPQVGQHMRVAPRQEASWNSAILVGFQDFGEESGLRAILK